MFTTMLLLFDASIHQNLYIAQEVQRGEDWEVKKEGGEAENRGMDHHFAGHKKKDSSQVSREGTCLVSLTLTFLSSVDFPSLTCALCR